MNYAPELEGMLQMVMSKLDEIDKRLDNLDSTMKSMDARIQSSGALGVKTLGETQATLGQMVLG